MKSHLFLALLVVPLSLVLILFPWQVAVSSLGKTSEERTAVFAFLHEGERGIPQGFTIAEQSHLKDVQGLFHKLSRDWWTVLVYCTVSLLAFFAFVEDPVSWLANSFRIAAVVNAVLMVIVALGIGFFFDGFFQLFHEFLFQGNWQFPADSHLIRLFPRTFFLTSGLFIIAFSLFIDTVLFLSASLLKRYCHSRSRS